MLANDVHQDYWVRLASYHLDDLVYKANEQWTGKVTGNQMINRDKFSLLMGQHFQKKCDPGLAQMELRAFQWKRSKPFYEFAMELFDMLRSAFPTIGAEELETIGSTFLNQKIPVSWQDRLGVMHQ